MNALGSSVVSLVFIAIGAGIVFFARNIAAKARRSLSWPIAEGLVSHSAVLLRTEQTSNSNNAAIYKADIAYRFKVQGRDYSSSQITLMDYSSSMARAEDLVARYPDGSSVSVYYNPANPSESVLEPGATRGIQILGLIGGIFAAAGVAFLFMSLTGRVHTAG